MRTPRRSHALDQVRLRIAQAAAKLIAEGQSDYHTAKMKAARQLGIDDKHALPDNLEIEAALREHLALFSRDRQPEALAALRRVAVRAMQWLIRADFEPWLTGAVLNGTANEFSAIELELVEVEAKHFEMFLLNANVDFELHETDVVQYELEFEDAPVRISLFSNHAARATAHPRTSVRHTRASRDEAIKLFDANPLKP